MGLHTVGRGYTHNPCEYLHHPPPSSYIIYHALTGDLVISYRGIISRTLISLYPKVIFILAAQRSRQTSGYPLAPLLEMMGFF